MHQRELRLIDRIERDTHFRRLRRVAHRNAEKRFFRARQHIVQLAKTLQLAERGLAVAFRGSYARRQPLDTSDVDLVLLRSSSAVAASSRALQSDSFRTTVVQFDVEGAAEFSNSLALWLAVPDLRYVTGDRLLFAGFTAKCRDELHRVTVGDLLRLYRADPMHDVDRFHPESPFAHNMKRGTGGIVEQQFLSLLHLRHEVRRERCSREQAHLLRAKTRHERYLFVVRDSAATATSYAELPVRAGPWFLRRDTVTAIAESLHDCAARFVALEST